MSVRKTFDSPKSEEQQTRYVMPPASWVDRLLQAMDGMPGPPWLAYVLLTLALALLGHMVRWVDGTLPFGNVDIARLAEAPMAFVFLALMHYLNRSARTSVSIFSPLLDSEESLIRRLQHEIGTIPRREAWIATGLGIAFAVGSVISNPASWGATDTSSVGVFIYAYGLAVLVLVSGLVFFVHTIRQLRQVNRIHALAGTINVWRRQPLYAFSTLTAQTAIGIALITYYYVFITYTLDLYGPVELSMLDAVGVAFFLALAIVSFMLPLYGMQRRLTHEKRRLTAEADRRFERTLHRLHVLIDGESFDGIEGLNKSMAGLQIELDALRRIPTWPWRPETFRGFVSSIAIPVILWLVTNLLGQVLGLR